MRDINRLCPEMRVAVDVFSKECKKQGLNVLITDTFRTKEEQEKLYAQGRTAPGNIVTNAQGYKSPHCWGVAFDFCRNVRGKEYDNSDGFFEKVGAIAKNVTTGELKLFWGGDFRSFVDKPHVELIKYMPNQSTKWLISTYGTPDKFIESWGEYKVEKVETTRYQTIEEVPEWGKKAIGLIVQKGFLVGKGDGKLDLSEDMVRIFVVNYNAGVYGN